MSTVDGSPPAFASAVRRLVLVKVERALPPTSPAYDLGPTEEQVTERWEDY